jgi:hypothetical protein
MPGLPQPGQQPLVVVHDQRRGRAGDPRHAYPAVWDAGRAWLCPRVLGQVRAEPGQPHGGVV